jgi:hypothetical protein
MQMRYAWGDKMRKCAKCNEEKLALIPLCQRCIIKDREEARKDERTKYQESATKAVIDTLPIVSAIGALSMIPSSKRRKNAAIKMVSIEFQKQLKEAREDERADLIEKLRTFFKAQMQKGKNADKHADEFRKQLPKAIQGLLDSPDCGEINMTWKDMCNIMDYSRMNGMSEWILLELYLSVKNDLGIDIRDGKASESAESDALTPPQSRRCANSAPKNACKSIYPIQPHSNIPPKISGCKCKECKLDQWSLGDAWLKGKKTDLDLIGVSMSGNHLSGMSEISTNRMHLLPKLNSKRAFSGRGYMTRHRKD